MKISIVEEDTDISQEMKNAILNKNDSHKVMIYKNKVAFKNSDGYIDSDLIFLDILFIDTDGLSIAREILDSNPSQKIIALTKSDNKALTMRLMDHGFYDSICKGSIREQVIKTIEPLIKQEIGVFY